MKASDFGRPGHVNPLRARDGGVLVRAGHTEGTVDLLKLAGLEPVGALIEIINPDGTMARLPELLQVAEEYGITITSIEKLIEYRLEKETLIRREQEVNLPTQWGDFKLIAYTQLNNGATHLALKKGDW